MLIFPVLLLTIVLPVSGIIGGNETVPHSRPYMVLLYSFNANFIPKTCDGFLVREDFVLSAAQCQNDFMRAFVGLHRASQKVWDDGMDVTTIPHPEYDDSTLDNDIMLLKLKTNVRLSEKVKPIALPKTKNETIPHQCLVFGWGCQDFAQKHKSDVLRELRVNLTDSRECTSPEYICTEGLEGPGKGDSGGPLVCDDEAHGIVSSLSISSTEDGYIFKYVRIEHYLPWIHKVMNS
ncbi:granzyme E [Chanos chanos]|uniref:Granzyme E n=1 Tax=Chanos chanos TaxID=29144 RepID=A0A6J2W8W8_CHACN|nr:granzyme E-like [Chanos chanos]